jgi:hypothetical protein
MFDEEIGKAIHLLKDKNLVWSSDFEGIRETLYLLMEKLWNDYNYPEAELGSLAILLIHEGKKIAGESQTTDSAQKL